MNFFERVVIAFKRRKKQKRKNTNKQVTGQPKKKGKAKKEGRIIIRETAPLRVRDRLWWKEKLLGIKREKKWTLLKLAKEAGISYQTLNSILYLNYKRVKPDTASRLGQLLLKYEKPILDRNWWRSHLSRIMQENQWNYTSLARKIDLNPVTIWYILHDSGTKIRAKTAERLMRLL